MTDVNERRIDTSAGYTSKPRENQKEQVEVADLRMELSAAKHELEVARRNLASPAMMLLPTMSMEDMEKRENYIQTLVQRFFRKGVHFGEPFPNAKRKDGTPILMLLKAGAEWIASSFGLRPDYVDEIIIRDTTATPPLVSYQYRCNLILIGTGQIVGSALGQCSTEEDKYKYRLNSYKCPNCDLETIKKSTIDGVTQWYCPKGKGGCGAKYPINAAEIMNQEKPGRVLNPETLALGHTIQTMAQKRAFVLAVRTALGLTAYFDLYEDIDDTPEDDNAIEGTFTRAEPPAVVAFVADEKPFDGTDIPGLLDFMIAHYPDLKDNKSHAGNRVWSAFEIKGWPELVKANLTRAQVLEKINQHMAEKAALA